MIESGSSSCFRAPGARDRRGPGDPTGRFSHWLTRIAEGGEVLAPGDGSTPVQFIDGRDLGAWIVRAIEDNSTGMYCALGPVRPITMKEVDKQNVSGWDEMPMWIDLEDMPGFGTLANKRAVAKGLAFRPIRDTAKDALAWLETLPSDEKAKARDSGIKREKEQQVLAAWRAWT